MKRPKLRIAAKFSIVLVVLVPAIAFLSWASLSGLGRIDTEVESLFVRNLVGLEAVDSTVAEIFQVEELVLLEDVDPALKEEARPS